MARHPLISPVISDLVNAALSGMDGVRFDCLDVCPYCGGEVRGYDFKKKRFACMMVGGTPRNIYVVVKRFHCLECGRLSYAHRPFYPDTRMGLPVVDLCVGLGRVMPFNRVSNVLKEMNVVVDRGTVRNYVNRQFCEDRSVDMFRLDLPFSVINLGIMMIQRGEVGPMSGREAFSAMGFEPGEWQEFVGHVPDADSESLK